MVSLISYLLLGSTGLAVGLMVVGSWFHRMAGVELLVALQMIYYLHFTVREYNQAVASFQWLSLLGLSDLFLQTGRQNFRMSAEYELISFSVEQAELSLLALSVLLLLPASLAVVGMLYSRCS